MHSVNNDKEKNTSQASSTPHHNVNFVDTVSLQGQLLIASPHIDDSRFQRSVIMMCQHDQSSAMGVVINHRSDELDIAQYVKHWKLAPQGFTVTSRFILVGRLMVAAASCFIHKIICNRKALP